MRTRRPPGERGAVAVEAALVIPILMLLVFGIIEWSLVMRDTVAVTSAVRAGGRTASSLAGAGPAGEAEGGNCVSPCTPANAPMLAQLAANAVQTSGTALPPDSVEELWIYEANDLGLPAGMDSDDEWACGTSCVRFTWVESTNKFRYRSGTWQSSTINACANSAPDSVGLYLRSRHEFITGLFGDGIAIDDHAVFAFEPLPTLTCAAGTHP